MADPLSVAASVIAVVQLTEKLISLGFVYIGGAKAASNDLRELVDELQSLGKVLVVLQEYAQADKNLQSTALQSLNGQNGPLQGCALGLRRLQLKLEPKQGLKGMIQSLKWPLEEQETLQCIARIQRQKNLFILALTVDHISLSKAIEAYIQNIDHTAEEIKASIQDTNATIHDLEAKFAAEFSAQDIWRKKQETLQIVENREKVLNWICPDIIEKKHLEISNNRQRNTGNWLLESPQFQELLNDCNSTLLWGYGIPGAGKTFLSSAVIDYLQDQVPINHHRVAYIYFDYKEQETQKPIHVLASLVKQLASQLPGPHLPKEIEGLHEKLRYQGKRPTLEELYVVLRVLLQFPSLSHSQVFLIFDALDECHPKDQRKDLLPLFHRLAADGARLFLTSRHYPEDIRQSFSNSKKIELVAKEEDIETYIQEKIYENPRAKRLVGQGGCKELIVSELIGCAKGMFLLVKFHVEYICQQTTAKQILDALQRLKSSSTKKMPLDPTYDRVIEGLYEQPEAYVELAVKVLSWLVKARRTLTVGEIQTAVSVELDRCELDETDLPDRAILLEVCASLVTIDEHSNTIRLAHYTVQDYLLRKSVIPEDADFKEPAHQMSSSKRLQAYPFLDYAAHNLSSHLNSCDDQEALSVDTILRFLASPGNISSYLQVVHAWGYGKGDSEHFNRYPKDHLPLHVASTLGHCAVIRVLLEGADFSVPDNTGWGNVYRAASKGHDRVVRLLIEKRADASASEINGLTALHMAATQGHTAAVQLLIEKGSDVVLPCNNGETALHLAASNGHEAVVRALLSTGTGTSISARDSRGRTALHMAASQGNLAVVQLLLSGGADVSVSENFGETALHMAASKEHESVIRLLLKSGASISARENFGRTALHMAVYQRNEAIVRLLLGEGADVFLETNSKETALSIAFSREDESIIQLLVERGAVMPAVLHLAASRGYKIVVQLLLENGANVSLMNNGSTALHLAVKNEHKDVVRLLLEKGADTSAVGGDQWTALHLAAKAGDEAVVQLLLEKGADISTVTGNQRTALYLAVENRHEGVARLLLEKGAAAMDNQETALHLVVKEGDEGMVRLLLEKGVDISAVVDNQQTALHLAARWGAKDVVQLLLEKGVDIEAVTDDQETALHLAAIRGAKDVVQLLLEKGADIEAVTNIQETALHLAALSGAKDVVQLLLEKGADIEAVQKDQWTALHLAARKGDKATTVVQLLLEKGADIEAVEKDQWTALHLAAIGGDEAITVVQLLLEKGADIEAVEEDQQTALHLAASLGAKDVVQLLLEKGADTSAATNGQETGLHLAAIWRAKDVVQLLLEKGINIFTEDGGGLTALELAILEDHDDVIQMLLNNSNNASQSEDCEVMAGLEYGQCL